MSEDFKEMDSCRNKLRNAWFVLVALVVLTLFSVIAVGVSSINHIDKITFHEETPTSVTDIGRDEFDKLIAEKKTFIVMLGRVSCKQCAIVDYVYKDMKGEKVKLYFLDLERYYGSDEYDAIKDEVGINYVPTFFYYEDGVQKYCMNNPLPDGYYDEDQDAEGRRYLRNKTAENISDFIKGATGDGEVVNEVPTSDVVVGVEETVSGG